MKGIVSVLELITASVILFIAISYILPDLSFENYWEQAKLVIFARDILSTLEAKNLTYYYAFDKILLENYILSYVKYENFTLLPASSTQGALKKTIIVACNCSDAQINELSKIQTLFFNNRTVTLNFVQANLDKIPPSDVLVIIGYKNLTPYKNELQRYLSSGNGIVEFSDITQEPDETHKLIFNFNYYGTITNNNFNLTLIKPKNVSYESYKAYKYLVYLPLFFNTTPSFSLAGCDPKTREFFLDFYSKSHRFLVCNSTFVYYDSDGNGDLDANTTLGNLFSIESQTMFLNYIGYNKTFVTLSYRNFSYPNYLPSSFALMQPSDNDNTRILIVASNQTHSYPAVIVDERSQERVAWTFDIFKNGLDDAEANLVKALLIWASNKKEQIPTYLKYGIFQDYIVTYNQDMFEVFRFTLALSYPF